MSHVEVTLALIPAFSPGEKEKDLRICQFRLLDFHIRGAFVITHSELVKHQRINFPAAPPPIFVIIR